MEYVESAGTRACIFCDPEPPRPDRERLILHRSASVQVLLNRFPYAPGHLLVAPLLHEGRLSALGSEVRSELMQRISDSAEILEKVYGSEGMNIGANQGAAAGAGFADHLHFHLVPRWAGDTNFMTVVGELRVIPKHLERILEELEPHFRELSS